VKIAVDQVKRQGGTIFGGNKSTGEAQSSWRDTVSLAVVVLVVLLTHSELAAHLSKLFLQSFTRAEAQFGVGLCRPALLCTVESKSHRLRQRLAQVCT
jgi:hypothetical protein